MIINQEPLYCEDSIGLKILTGEYVRSGSVVRDRNGQIVKHLKTIDLPETEEAAKAAGVSVMRFIEGNKTTILLLGVITATVLTASGVYCTIKKKREERVLSNFREAFRVYIQSIRDGKLEYEQLENLIAAIDEIKKHDNYEKFVVRLTIDEIETILTKIQEYTNRLAEINSYEIKKMSQPSDCLMKLQQCLYIQRDIFKKAA